MHLWVKRALRPTYIRDWVSAVPVVHVLVVHWYEMVRRLDRVQIAQKINLSRINLRRRLRAPPPTLFLNKSNTAINRAIQVFDTRAPRDATRTPTGCPENTQSTVKTVFRNDKYRGKQKQYNTCLPAN